MVLVLGGDATGLAGYAKVAANYNTATQKHLSPLGHGGPNGVYALVASRQIKKYGLEKSDYGHIAIAQREWAAKNPYAVYRAPLTMDGVSRRALGGRSAVALRLRAGGGGRAGDHRGAARPRAEGQAGRARARASRAATITTTNWATACKPASARSPKELWREAGVRPDDIDVASIYDDYPTMVLAQANDLGLIPGSDLARFCRVTIGEQRFPVNTWGGMLSAGQPGGHAGGLNGISEAVLQLQHRAGERQVKDARLAVATGYGMTMYRYGGTAAAAILERVE